ncbi:MAG: ATPase, T2SS/T4P/T4SS family [Bacteriovoracaceae bacterium]|nr:ATPase, T2SS/T4P/T4SS family [Bacteriovoracaceae bacterium]
MIKEEFLELVAKTGLATIKDLRKIAAANKDPNKIGEFDLLDISTFNETLFATQMSEQYKVPFLDLSTLKIQPDVISRLQKKNVLKYRLIVVKEEGDKATFVTFDPLAATNVKVASDLLNRQGSVILVTISAWKRFFEHVRLSVEEVIDTVREVQSDSPNDQDVRAEDIGADIVTFVNRLLADAYIRRASDIHIEPYEKRFRVRFRIDGNLIEVISPAKQIMAPVISRVKILARLDISEKRKPQDGRIKLAISGKTIDYRVSTLPTLFGEKVVMRLLDSSSLQLDLTKLGFLQQQLKGVEEGIKKPFGMVLVTGPTGSGKTTTLYSALQALNTPDTNISTAEDPCEYNLEGVNQVNVKTDIGFTFAAAMKAFLRQDPDVIMVGEIRDQEVAEIAVEAALTGHLVLSTLHTNDAASTITRLLNLGIEGFLVVAALNCIVSQRLLRRICQTCKVEVPGQAKNLIACGVSPDSAEKITVYKGAGCTECGGLGYKGRIAVHEVLTISPVIKEMVLAGASADAIKLQAVKDGMRTLRMAAIIKVAMGQTTLEEAVGNSASDHD